MSILLMASQELQKKKERNYSLREELNKQKVRQHAFFKIPGFLW